MMEQDEACEKRLAGEALEYMGRALHHLCQPLTTLQCRLEIAGLIGTAEAYREAVDLGLAECARLVESVESMREILRTSQRDQDLTILRER